MNVPVRIELQGIEAAPLERGIDLDVFALDVASSWCGSYDILQMGDHFDAYILTPRSLLLPPINGFPASRRFTRLPGKRPAPSVQGNIGEAVAALTAAACLGFEADGIAHIKGSVEKAPDLLLRVTDNFTMLVNQLCRGFVTLPQWIPCEAKCRKSQADISAAVRTAMPQLRAFWSDVSSAEAGFGIVCCFIHRPPQSIHVKVIIPQSAIDDGQQVMSAILATAA